jgi:hypothetical protein
VLGAVGMLQAMLQVILRGAGSARRALRLVRVMLTGRYAYWALCLLGVALTSSSGSLVGGSLGSLRPPPPASPSVRGEGLWVRVVDYVQVF